MTKNIYDPDYVKDLFDRCSPAYRNWSAIASFGFVNIWRRQTVARLIGQLKISELAGGPKRNPQTAPVAVVDLMAGTGEVWPHVMRQFPNAQITAIDISKRMHDEAVTRLHSDRCENIEHLQANALETDLPDAMADAVVSTFGLKTFDPDQQEILAEQIARLLRPGAVFCAIEASDPKNWTLRPLYRFYMDRVLPLIERLALRGAQDFAMIGIYTTEFENAEHFADALRKQGLKVSYKSHFFGCATSVAGYKPVEPAATTS